MNGQKRSSERYVNPSCTGDEALSIGIIAPFTIKPMVGFEPTTPLYESGALPLSYIGKMLENKGFTSTSFSLPLPLTTALTTV